MIIWVIKIFLYSSSVYSCHLLYHLLLLGPDHFCPLLCPFCMKSSLGISNFLEEISSLSHSNVFLYFFALITEEGFLISPCYSWNSAFKWPYLSFSPLPFTSLLFIGICKASSDSHFAFLHFFFLVMVLIHACCTMYHEPPSIVLQALCLSDLVP